MDLAALRNIGILAHIDAGKTTLTERILFIAGVSWRMGEVYDGTAVMDWMEQEQERGITITSAATRVRWCDHAINIIDTPGHVDFTVEVERSLRVLDACIVVFSAVEGVQPQSETVWRQADAHEVPRLAFVNKMDRVGADFEGAIRQIRQRLRSPAVAFQLPVFRDDEHTGAVDLLRMELVTHGDDPHRVEVTRAPVPEEYADEAWLARQLLVEAIADTDDALLERYLEKGELTLDELVAAARRAVLQRRIVPVFCGSAFQNRGVQPLLDAVLDFLPSPLDRPPIDPRHPPDADAPFAALVFKLQADAQGVLSFLRVYSGSLAIGDTVLNVRTKKRLKLGRLYRMHAMEREELRSISAGEIVAAMGAKDTTTGDTLCDPRHPVQLESIAFPEPVLFVAVEPETDADQIKLSDSLARLREEDPTLQVRRNVETGQTILCGMGELHLEIASARLEREFGVRARFGRPQVAYREAILRSAAGAERVDRKVGPKGFFAAVSLTIEEAEGIVVEFGEVGISGEHQRAAEAGIRERLLRGHRAGFPVHDILVRLVDAEENTVDSCPGAFRVAGGLAVEKALASAGVVVLEPMMQVEVSVPDDYVGGVVGDLNSRRGRVTDITAQGGRQTLVAELPLASMFGYATALRSLTQGRAGYSMVLLRYSPMPAALSDRVFGVG